MNNLAIVLKELKESRFWLGIIYRINIINSKIVESIIDECEELIAIIAKSIITAKTDK
ncbi:four helix bundle protein [bacterium]|nr:four helix bundle protein [bacterium]